MGKRKKEELPDYTVAKMDVDGMPWNSRRPWQILPGDPSKHRKEFDVKVPEQVWKMIYRITCQPLRIRL